jgi:hypothetical protein
MRLKQLAHQLPTLFRQRHFKFRVVKLATLLATQERD